MSTVILHGECGSEVRQKAVHKSLIDRAAPTGDCSRGKDRKLNVTLSRTGNRKSEACMNITYSGA